eukprot:XP_011671012.1 PREDICTED: mucin-1-like [Strongylocentrotus purpuratus]
MFSKWRTNTEIKNQLSKLKTALVIAGLKGVAQSFFEALQKESAKRKAKGRAGTSTAVRTKRTPAKKPAQRGTKTMKTNPISAKKVSPDVSKPALQKGPAKRNAKGKAGTSTAVRTKRTPAKKPAQRGTKTMKTNPISAKKVSPDVSKPALQKRSKAPSGTAQSSKDSSNKEGITPGTSPAIADKKPTTKSTPAKMLPQEGTKTTETKPTSAIKKVPQGDPKPGASILKDSTQFRENVRSGKGISAPKEQAKKRKAPEEKNALNNKIRKSNSTHPPSDVNDGGSATVHASDSAIVRDNKVTGKEVNNISFNVWNIPKK